MAIKINYEDDIFLLQMIIKTLNAAIRLEVDVELFRDRLVEDIHFIHATVQKLYRTLHENPHLIRRDEYLRAIMQTKVSFIEVLHACLDTDTPQYVHLAAYAGRVHSHRSEHLQDVEDIRALLQRGDDDESRHEDVVSPQEFLSLLQRDEDDGSDDQ